MEEPGPGCSLSRLYSFGKRVSAVCSAAVKQCSVGGKYIQWEVTHTGCDSDTGLVTLSRPQRLLSAGDCPPGVRRD